MKTKKLMAIFLSIMLIASLAACGNSSSSSSSSSAAGGGTSTAGGSASSTAGSSSTADVGSGGTAEPIKVGIVLGLSGLGDKNFNDMAYEGLLLAEKDLGITFDYVEPASPSDFLPSFRTMCETGEYALIIGMGADQAEALTEISEDFPDQKFSHVDSTLDLVNVSGVQTKWQEQTFLTGVMAGLGTLSDMDKANQDNKIGVILGMDNPVLRMGVVGFTAGARYVNPDCEVLEGIVDSFSDPGKGKEIALAMYNQGADFVQAIAGSSSLGIYNAAQEADRYAFGVGANVNDLEPDNIVATAMRKVGDMVYNEVKAVKDGTWEGGLHISGIKEDAVGYDAAQSNVPVPDDIQKAIEDIRQKIISGELVPCSKADELDAWVTANQYKK